MNREEPQRTSQWQVILYGVLLLDNAQRDVYELLMCISRFLIRRSITGQKPVPRWGQSSEHLCSRGSAAGRGSSRTAPGEQSPAPAQLQVAWTLHMQKARKPRDFGNEGEHKAKGQA